MGHLVEATRFVLGCVATFGVGVLFALVALWLGAPDGAAKLTGQLGAVAYWSIFCVSWVAQLDRYRLQRLRASRRQRTVSLY